MAWEAGVELSTVSPTAITTFTPWAMKALSICWIIEAGVDSGLLPSSAETHWVSDSTPNFQVEDAGAAAEAETAPMHRARAAALPALVKDAFCILMEFVIKT